MTAVTDALAAIFDDQSHDVFREGEAVTRWQPRAYICHTPREES